LLFCKSVDTNERHSTKPLFAECHFAECRGASVQGLESFVPFSALTFNQFVKYLSSGIGRSLLASAFPKKTLTSKS
jgi:hypothetical protein